PNAGMSKLVVPGFNDHNVILFGKNIKKPQAPAKTTYTPIDNVEKNSINIYNKIAPSVVEIAVKSIQQVVDPQSGEVTEIPSGGFGSGSILDKEGYIVTNFHVIKVADEITVILDKDKEAKATVIGSDPSSDLAVLKLDMPKAELEKLPIMKLGNSKDAIGGQRVFAIGNPFNLYRTVTQGIVSALERTIVSPGGRLTKGIIQTDASINPGNSGGALVNAKGEQIGINSQIYSPSGASAGLGFAIPIDLAKKIINDLKTEGRVIRPYLGLSGGLPVEALPPQLNKMLGIDKLEGGVILQNIIPDGPAAKAGLKGGEIGLSLSTGQTLLIGGDVITEISGQPVSNMTEIFELLDEKAIGEEIEIGYRNLSVEPNPPAGIKGTLSEHKTIKIVIEETPKPKTELKDHLHELNNNNMPKPLETDRDRDFQFRSH
ncbi:MAG: S1C family serine protease, partial [Vampirovibrionia bacterium]